MVKKNKLKDAIMSLFIGVVLTLSGMTISLLIAMFQSKDAGKRYGFFKTVYFENREHQNGSISVSLGLTEIYIPIFISVLIMTLCVYTFLRIYNMLYEHKKSLDDV